MDDWRMNGELFLADPDRGRTAADFGIVPQLCYNRRRRDDEKVTKSETIRARLRSSATRKLC